MRTNIPTLKTITPAKTSPLDIRSSIPEDSVLPCAIVLVFESFLLLLLVVDVDVVECWRDWEAGSKSGLMRSFDLVVLWPPVSSRRGMIIEGSERVQMFLKRMPDGGA